MSGNGSHLTRRAFVKGVGAVTTGTALLSQGVLPAHAASTSSQKLTSHDLPGAGINVLLVHGTFTDASSWNKVIPLLQSRGYNVLAVQNPNTSLEDDIATTSQALASLSGPTILVGHSYGGFVISNIALGSATILSLVYVSAFAPEANESVLSISTQYPAPAGQYFVPSYRSGFIWIEPAKFAQNFVQDVSATEGQVLMAVQKPLALECFGAPSGVPIWHRFPSWFLVSANDRVISPDAERFMAKRMKATTREIPSSHASPVSHPIEVFELILAATPSHH